MDEKHKKLLEQVERGKGSDWLYAKELLVFCDIRLETGLGVTGMEGIQAPEGTVGRNSTYEIYGLDGDEAWEKHHDPVRSVALVREKLKWAEEDARCSSTHSGSIGPEKPWLSTRLDSVFGA